MSFAKITELEVRLKEQEVENRYLQYELKCLKEEARQLRADFDDLFAHQVAHVESYNRTVDKIDRYNKDHDEEHRTISMLLGNAITAVAPDYDVISAEIDRALEGSPVPKKPI